VRKQMGEKPEPAGGEKAQPESGERSPEKPAEAMPRGGSPEDKETPPPDAERFPAWVTSLPPEIRDALVGGDAESIPARYRDLILRYNLWLQKRQGSGDR